MIEEKDLLKDRWLWGRLQKWYVPELTPLGKELFAKAKPIKKDSNILYTNYKGYRIEWQELYLDDVVPKQIAVQIFKSSHHKNGSKIIKLKP